MVFSGWLQAAETNRPPAEVTFPKSVFVDDPNGKDPFFPTRNRGPVVVVAKTPVAMHALARQFSARTVQKRYRAIVLGAPRAPEGVIDLAIGRDPVDRKRMQARVGQTRAARTRYTVHEAFGTPAAAALLEVAPETGRTHQIRVHLAERMGTPVLGDPLYGKPPQDPALRAIAADLGHQALHARVLGFVHPATGREMRWESALPADFERALAALRVAPAQGAETAAARSGRRR